MNKETTIVINLFGAPGTGKSTTAAGLFNLMKTAGLKCELLTEFAKKIVWHERHKELDDQLYITAVQNHEIEMLVDKVDYIITDSPLMLGAIYQADDYHDKFTGLIKQVFNSYNNVNFLLSRVKNYNHDGRTQTEEESNEVAIQIKDFMNEHEIEYTELLACPDAHKYIYNKLQLFCEVN